MASHATSMTTTERPNSSSQLKQTLTASELNGFPGPHSLSTPPRSSTHGEDSHQTGHTIKLSSIEHCMPRAYIRVCLAFCTSSSPKAAQDVLAGLGRFVQRTINALPFLAGYVGPANDSDGAIGRVEIRFTEEDIESFPVIQKKWLTAEEMPLRYDKLIENGLPPSTIRPDLISALPEDTGDNRSPVFRVQANLLDGGLIISIYLHHCVSDGHGLGLLVSGALLRDASEPERLGNGDHGYVSPGHDLATIAARETQARRQLSWANQVNSRRQLRFKLPEHTSPYAPAHKGRGCVFSFSHATLQSLHRLFLAALPPNVDKSTGFLTEHDVLHALLWHHLTQARTPSLSTSSQITISNLLIPVNIRGRIIPPLPSSYFGSAVDFASVTLPLDHLGLNDVMSMTVTALAVRDAVQTVGEGHVREVIALSNQPGIDVRDLQATNMNRTTGADMYITSWLKLPLYDKGDLGMGLGKPDWVRKPWSRDPGACIILPQHPTKKIVEVVVQMAEADMARLLVDHTFMGFVESVIE